MIYRIKPINQSINIRLIKAWQNASLYNWVIRHTNKKYNIKETPMKRNLPVHLVYSVSAYHSISITDNHIIPCGNHYHWAYYTCTKNTKYIAHFYICQGLS